MLSATPSLSPLSHRSLVYSLVFFSYQHSFWGHHKVGMSCLSPSKPVYWMFWASHFQSHGSRFLACGGGLRGVILDPPLTGLLTSLRTSLFLSSIQGFKRVSMMWRMKSGVNTGLEDSFLTSKWLLSPRPHSDQGELHA